MRHSAHAAEAGRVVPFMLISRTASFQGARSDEKRKFRDSDHTGVYEQLTFVMNFMVVGNGKQFDPWALKVGMRVSEFACEFRIGQSGIGGVRFLCQLSYDIQDLSHRAAGSYGRHADFPFPRFGL
jgi:hypothetical protein